MSTTAQQGTRRSTTRGSVTGWVLRLLVVAALLVDAAVHLHLASGYQSAAPGGIGAGNLFRLEAAVAILAALYVLIRGSRLAFGCAFLVSASALFAVLLFRYVQVPAFGPIPSMYEPVWFFEKSLSAVAEAAGVLLAVVGLLLTKPRRASGKPAEGIAI